MPPTWHTVFLASAPRVRLTDGGRGGGGPRGNVGRCRNGRPPKDPLGNQPAGTFMCEKQGRTGLRHRLCSDQARTTAMLRTHS